MRLLLDEQLSPTIAEQLQRRGHDVVSVASEGLRGYDDAAVLNWASSHRRGVVTNNIRDFRPLHAATLSAATRHYGIILLASSKFSFRLDALGVIVAALDKLLSGHTDDDELSGQEYFL